MTSSLFGFQQAKGPDECTIGQDRASGVLASRMIACMSALLRSSTAAAAPWQDCLTHAVEDF